MLLPSLGNKQHKVNKIIFEKGPMFFFQNFYKNKDLIFFFFSFVLIFFNKENYLIFV